MLKISSGGLEKSGKHGGQSVAALVLHASGAILRGCIQLVKFIILIISKVESIGLLPSHWHLLPIDEEANACISERQMQTMRLATGPKKKGAVGRQLPEMVVRQGTPGSPGP
ncbi:hypothetical protein GFB56_07415 [Ensifer sp. T173]|uniref:Uncharacterized protein n=1 Tax=Ensifer canadensis TaxID=555315 RepID=A0AAW4FJG4_9HYPH|nr:hypothetical protein [Ensifer canadensis]MBM3090640.1 hypothetical protein [Ensifer canadensis]UBI80739.1 hypothetical protein J3R84_34360 [Ensifer canadensis]